MRARVFVYGQSHVCNQVIQVVSGIYSSEFARLCVDLFVFRLVHWYIYLLFPLSYVLIICSGLQVAVNSDHIC